ncbi:MAG: methionyl-tRNA formyltransferase [Rhizobiaceae bacterium]
MTLRIIFMGTPDFSVPTLQALHKAGHEIVACYSQPPRPAGRRGLELKPSPVQVAAEEMGIPVYTPTSLKGEDEQEIFTAHNADVAVVVAYGLLLPQAILDTPKSGCFNGHASLLPRWRGAAPIQRAIMAGDKETGVMVMQMELGLDTGPVAMTARVPIDEDTTAGSLHDTLSIVGAELMVEAMAELEAGELKLTPQSEDGTVYAAKILKDETRVDWSKPAAEVQRHIMGISPFPGAWCEMELGGKLARVKLLEARLADGKNAAGTLIDNQLAIACGTGAVRLTRLQKAGSKPMNADEFLRGNTLTTNTVLR